MKARCSDCRYSQEARIASKGKRYYCTEKGWIRDNKYESNRRCGKFEPRGERKKKELQPADVKDIEKGTRGLNGAN